MNYIEIKRVTLGDIAQLQSVGKQTFSETFSDVNTAENMKKYLDEAFSGDKLMGELMDNNAEFYFAILDHQVIGYLKVNFGSSQTELKEKEALEIESIYVLREFHGKKVGQALYEKAMQIAGKRNARYVWLGVWERNYRAQRFYCKNGFVAFDRHIFKLGDELQTDIMMKLSLKDKNFFSAE